MARKARHRISYVLPLANSSGGHRLGVNSLAVDLQGILYSAGRDGVICSWDLGVNLSKRSHIESTCPSVPSSTIFRSNIQAHTHWVNDLVLSNCNELIVSCSSDLTVKLWRPHSATQQAHSIGIHSDYVKCLATPSVHSHWVASGGLDRKIKFWDLNGSGEILQIDVGDDGNNPKGSIYSLGIGGDGGILASGGPEGVVRVWDPRSGKPITKFVGHTDNVRSILVNEHGSMVLTASSDTTIKLWSLTAGRCMHTLSMHNDSVWSLHSSDPGLEIFHSSDRSGLLAKTDLRNVAEVENGICVAVCQERGGINKVVGACNYIWTATSSSNINRWLDVDTNLDLITDIRRSRLVSSAYNRPWVQYPASPGAGTLASLATRNSIPINSILHLSTSSSFPSNVQDPETTTMYSVASSRQLSTPETLMDGNPGIPVPLNVFPDETIEGQRGLLKHFLLNDRRRVLTVDTTGEVVMWDLLKCIPVKSFGERHLEDVAMEVNTMDSIANWCQVDIRTGKLACVLEESYCFDAEIYADEADIEETLEFKDDQRINMGKWVLRYLFSNLIDEQIRRDNEYRKTLEKQREDRERLRKTNELTLPVDMGGRTVITPTVKPTISGYSLFPHTPGLGIGIAPNVNTPFISTPWEDSNNKFTSSIDRQSGDYFSTGSGTYNGPVKNGASTLVQANEEAFGTPSTDKEKEEKDSSLFGNLKWRSFGAKKLGRSASTDIVPKSPLPTTDDKTAEQVMFGEPSNKLAPCEETLAGVVRRIRMIYDSQDRDVPGEPIISVISPSLPQETPILKLQCSTTIIVQEDNPDSGGVADLYRGTVGCVGEDADLLEKVAPAWLGELILLNRIPFKETMKVSFVLVPWQDELPVLPSESGSEGKNSRLNANRMLRAKKIIGYVAEHLQLPFMSVSFSPELNDGEETPRYEDWLELVCNNQVVAPTMTLATMRSYIWKTGGDVVLYYRKKHYRATP
ncbi:hypothetical protein BDD12DRAFT_866837 [Trichophaea hybrida]|nr:hypothetical protein BDD12DRAFT_866837 [Trichophaea hybrida]